MMLKSAIKTKIAKILRGSADVLTQAAISIESADVLGREEKNIIARCGELKDIHKNKRAFIIGNGPSVKDQNLLLLHDEISFVVNSFYKHEAAKGINPKYYCLLDPAFFQDNTNSYDFYRNLKANIDDPTYLVSLDKGYEFCRKHTMLPKDKTYFVASYGYHRPKEIDLTKQIPGFINVAIFSLSMAVYMGCNPIYLIGSDLDFLAHRGKDHHFYEGGSDLKGKAFDDVREKTLEEIRPYLGQMQNMQKVWEQYQWVKDVAERKGIKIFNATRGGYLDLFPRVRYESLFGDNKG